MQMIHDLTQDKNLFKPTSKDLALLSLNINTNKLHYESKEDLTEVILTGDYLERQTKKYYKDFNTDRILCDCCGREVIKVPWREERVGKLCKSCLERLDKLIASKGERVASEVAQINKPWEYTNIFEERRNELEVQSMLSLWD